jgi:hypothetical protein
LFLLLDGRRCWTRAGTIGKEAGAQWWEKKDKLHLPSLSACVEAGQTLFIDILTPLAAPKNARRTRSTASRPRSSMKGGMYSGVTCYSLLQQR